MTSTSGAGRFAGSTAIVTGSTRGIGEAIAHRLASEGAAVVIAGRSTDAGERVAAEIREDGGRATYVETDVRVPESVDSLFDAALDHFDTVDVLVNNAAVQSNTSPIEVTLEEWDRLVETNFRAYWLCARRFATDASTGSVVNVSSNHALATMPAHFPYNAIKAGINGMTRAMALDFGPAIRVNTVSPGWVAVERTTGDMSADRREALAALHPVGRIGEPADVAAATAYLASDDAAFVTGTNLVVDGGRSAVLQDDTLRSYPTEE